MRLLILTQTVDSEDPVLGFFHGWIAALAPQYESIEVICLNEGAHALGPTVRIHSLGKEKGRRSPVVYALHVFSHLWRLRQDYDAVFVHMNQEYLLLAGWLWNVSGKPVYFWRNHYAGSWLTDLAAVFCRKVFCTSTHSYTAKYKKTVLMPVGVDTHRFHNDSAAKRIPGSILFLARIAPSKRLDLFIDALELLHKKKVNFSASVYGSPEAHHDAYYELLKRRVHLMNLDERIRFHPAVPNEITPKIYHQHEIFVNCSPSGMFDKTILEAAASGCSILAASTDVRDALSDDYYFDTADVLAVRLEGLLSRLSEGDREELATFVYTNSLDRLTLRLAEEIRA